MRVGSCCWRGTLLITYAVGPSALTQSARSGDDKAELPRRTLLRAADVESQARSLLWWHQFQTPKPKAHDMEMLVLQKGRYPRLLYCFLVDERAWVTVADLPRRLKQDPPIRHHRIAEWGKSYLQRASGVNPQEEGQSEQPWQYEK